MQLYTIQLYIHIYIIHSYTYMDIHCLYSKILFITVSIYDPFSLRREPKKFCISIERRLVSYLFEGILAMHGNETFSEMDL